VSYLVLVLVFNASAFAAKIQPVYSLKNLGDHQYDSGKSYQKVQIKCNTSPDLRYIHRDAGREDWCVEGDSAECFSERIEAATRACSVARDSLVTLDSSPAKTQQETSQALVERAKLEEELLENEQRKIELRSRQLELRKRELELIELKSNN